VCLDLVIEESLGMTHHLVETWLGFDCE